MPLRAQSPTPRLTFLLFCSTSPGARLEWVLWPEEAFLARRSLSEASVLGALAGIRL